MCMLTCVRLFSPQKGLPQACTCDLVGSHKLHTERAGQRLSEFSCGTKQVQDCQSSAVQHVEFSSRCQVGTTDGQQYVLLYQNSDGRKLVSLVLNTTLLPQVLAAENDRWRNCIVLRLDRPYSLVYLHFITPGQSEKMITDRHHS